MLSYISCTNFWDPTATYSMCNQAKWDNRFLGSDSCFMHKSFKISRETTKKTFALIVLFWDLLVQNVICIQLPDWFCFETFIWHTDTQKTRGLLYELAFVTNNYFCETAAHNVTMVGACGQWLVTISDGQWYPRSHPYNIVTIWTWRYLVKNTVIFDFVYPVPASMKHFSGNPK